VPEKYLNTLLQRQKSLGSIYTHFSGAGEVFLYIRLTLIWYLSGAGEAWEVFENTFPAPGKYLYTLFRCWRSAYIHLSGAGEAGEAGEVFIYTGLIHIKDCEDGLSSYRVPDAAAIADVADSRLLATVIHNDCSHHLLKSLFPPAISRRPGLRRRQHEFTLSEKDDSNFIPRVLYRTFIH